MSGSIPAARRRASMTPEFILRNRWLTDRFERQTQPFLGALYRAARRLTAHPADAEDLVHDTYIKAFTAYGTADLRDEAACRAWLFRIMTNTYRDRYRRMARSPEVAWSPLLEEIDGCMWSSREPGPEARLDYKRFVQAADVAIASLPVEVRLVVVLFFVEELSYREIAEIAQCPVGTVMSRLWRGRRMLRQQLRAYGEPAEASDTAMTSRESLRR
jgi:RNA polymerase sigma-70 factor (ECF subfamily)